MSGPGREQGKVYISQDVDAALNAAQAQADHMKDEYVSVEHVFLGLIERANSAMKSVFEQFGIRKDAFLAALQSVRGGQRVTSETPEETYDALKKYGQEDVYKRQEISFQLRASLWRMGGTGRRTPHDMEGLRCTAS